MKKYVFIVVLVSLLLIPLYVHAIQFPTTINFDTDPSSNPIPDATVINNTYSSQGVTFSCSGGACNGNDVYAVDLPSYATSDPNVVSIYSSSPFFSEYGGIIRASFDGVFNCPSGLFPAVSITKIGDDDQDPGFLRAYDHQSHLVSTAVSPGDAGSGVPEFLTVVAGDIAYVEFAGVDGETVVFDDLVTGCGTTTPTMTEWGMIIFMVLAGIGSVYFLYSRRRTGITG